ncbi:MAG: YcxB family protein [Bacillota bacterium]
MHLEYRMDVDDLVNINYHHYMHTKETRITRALLKWGLPLVFYMGVVLKPFVDGRASVTGVFLGLLGVIAWLFIYPRQIKVLVRRGVSASLDKNRNKLGIVGMDITAEGIRSARGDLSWSEIYRVVNTRDYTCIFGVKARAFIIPCRAFSDAKGFKEFQRMVEKYRMVS